MNECNLRSHLKLTEATISFIKVGGGDGYPIFERTGKQDQNWHMAQVSLDSEYTSQPFKVCC